MAISRRELLAGSMFSFVYPQELNSQPAARKATTTDRSRARLAVYMAQNGQSDNLAQSSVYVVGVLSTSATARQHHAIELLRKRHHFCTELRYGSTDKFKVDFSKNVVEYVARTLDLQFSARVIRKIDQRTIAPAVRIQKYVQQYKSAFEDHLRFRRYTPSRVGDVVVKVCNPEPTVDLLPILKNQWPTLQQAEFASWERLCGRPIKSRIPDYDSNNLIQIARFLTGLVYGEAMGERFSAHNFPAASSLRRVLGVESLIKGSPRKGFLIAQRSQT